MLSKLFNNKSKTITSAAIILGAASLLSRLLGLIRDRVLAGEFGAGAELDMYYAAFRIPDMVFNLLVLGALSAGFIPIFMAYLKNKNSAWELANITLNVMILCLAILSALMIILAPWILKIITPGFDKNQLEITTKLTRIMFLSPIFLGISGIFGGILQSFKKFFIYSISPILYNIGIIFGALFFVPLIGLSGLAWGVVLGAFAHMLIQLLAAIPLGYRYRFILDLNNSGVRKIIKMMLPRTLGLVVSQLNFLIVTIIGSTLAAGSIAIFNLANNIQSFPLGIFGVSFAIAAFPALSEIADKKKEFINTLSLTIRQILFFIIPSSAMLIVLRAQFVRVILGSGRFSWEDTVITLETLSLFAISLFAQAIILVLIRAFYAQQDANTPFYAGLISAFANIILAVILAEPFGVLGLALSFSLANILNLTLLGLLLHNKLGKLDGEKILYSFVKIIVATFLLSITAQAVKYPIEKVMGLDTLIGVTTQAASAALAGISMYFLVCWLLKSEELNIFINSLKKRFLKNPVIAEEIIEKEKLT